MIRKIITALILVPLAIVVAAASLYTRDRNEHRGDGETREPFETWHIHFPLRSNVRQPATPALCPTTA